MRTKYRIIQRIVLLTPDQWRRIERLFESVEDAPPEERERLVYESGEDDSIRWQVLKMLAAASEDGGLLDVNLRARPASVYSPGDLLLGGRFRIEALIAEGGMGEVYRAFDTELSTEVALKTIHRVLAHDSFAVERFKQEVQLARSVNHPNVCRIFDLEKQPGRNGRDQFFLTMELLSGENLRQFLDREKKVSTERALEIIEPVLQALTASHDRGVLHRDLKPSNIHLAQSNKPGGGFRVVVTDFGLATSAFSGKSGLAISAGTPAYMAPEQFDQREITPATDLYAVGVLLYELLAGRLPFTAKTPEEIGEQKRLDQAIPIRNLVPDIPKRWESAIHRALQAAPEKRVESAAAFLAAIRPRRGSLLRWGRVAAAVCVVAASLGFYWNTKRLSGGSLASRKFTADSGYSMEPTISSDGTFVIYASDRATNGVRALWRVATNGESSPEQLTFGEVDDHEPHLSRDGRRLVFRSERNGGGLYLLDLSSARTAEPRRVVDGGARARFSPDGNWILYMAAPATATQLPQVYAVRAQGGNPIHISAGFSDAHNPIWSEDGKFILFCGTKTPGILNEEHDWWVIPFATGGVARKSGVLPALSTFAQKNTGNRLNEDLWEWLGGYVYFSSPIADSSSIWRLRFSPGSSGFDPGSPPERLTYGTGLDTQPAIGGGHIVFASGISNIDVWTLPLNPNTGEPRGSPQRVTDTTDYEVSPTADREGRKLVFTKAIGGRRELRFLEWGKDHDSVSWSSAGQVTDHPLFSPDGRSVAYRLYEKPKLPVDVKSLSGEVRRVCDDCGAPTDWSPDGRYLLYEPGSTIAFVSRLDVATGKWEEWLQHPRFSLRGGRYSADGKWIAFQAETSRNARRIFVAPNRKQDSEREWIAIGWDEPDTDSDRDPPVDLLPSWSPDGKLIYFLSGRDGFRCIWAQKLDPLTKRPTGPPFHVQHFHRSRRSLLRIVSARSPQIGFRVYRDRAFFSMDEVTGNLWIAELPHD